MVTLEPSSSGQQSSASGANCAFPAIGAEAAVREAAVGCARARGWRVATIDADRWASIQSETGRIAELQRVLGIAP